MNWKLVRGIGGLTVLTKASYFTLILVPILAAIWPAIRRFLNGYNSTVEQTVLILENTTYTLEEGNARIDAMLSDQTAANDSLAIISQEIISGLQSRIPKLIEESTQMSIENTNLPSIWVWAFLAALGVFIAHTIYETLTPEIVKRFTSTEYSESQMDLYINNPTVSQVQNALGLEDYFTERSAKVSANRLRTSYYEERISEQPEKIEILQDEKKKAELEVIGAFGRLHYSEKSRKYPFAAFIACLLYLFSIGILLFVTYSQSLKVLQAAGWL